MSVTFRQLEVFVEAARDCNFRKTADRLGISQPSVSNQIRVLERWAGCELFQRTRGATPRLSAEGATLLKQAQDLLTGKRLLSKTDRAASSKHPLRLRIAAGQYLLENHIRPALSGFLATHKGIDLDFLPLGAAKDMRAAVRAGEADIAAYTGRHSERRVAGAEFVCEIPCSLYGNARFAEFADKSPSTLASLPFILPAAGSSLERWLLRTLKKSGIAPRNIVARSQFADVICDMVVAGKGVSLLFDEHMREHVLAGRAVRIGHGFESASRVLFLGKRARGRAAAPFLSFLRQVLRRD